VGGRGRSPQGGLVTSQGPHAAITGGAEEATVKGPERNLGRGEGREGRNKKQESSV